MNGLITTVHASTLSETLGQVGEFENVSTIEGAVQTIVNIALPLAGTVALILFVIAGYKIITSQGNPDKLKDAKDMITNAVIGLVFILLSVGILVLISNLFNLEAFT
ncbi:TPA: hypothetical protein DEP90_00225 [Patescibacteria group bacterium]|nr:hypothetical protein [Patescibacteria group bacterium]